MKYLSVCSGIEAASVAWHPLGWEPVAFSEIDPFASQVLNQRFPNVPNLGDMNKYAEWKLPAFDLLVGGTPCQSFSVAGLRRGLEDPRGNLALVYLGILDRFRPRWCVWENVPGVLQSSGGRDFGSFLGGLGKLGYGFSYRVLDAQYVRVESHPYAVPQRRRRVFVVGHSRDWRSAAEVLLEPSCLRGDPPSREKTRARSTRGASPSVGSCSAEEVAFAQSQQQEIREVTHALTEETPQQEENPEAMSLISFASNLSLRGGDLYVDISPTVMRTTYINVTLPVEDEVIGFASNLGSQGGDVYTGISPTVRVNSTIGIAQVTPDAAKGDQTTPITVISSGHGWWSESQVGATLRAQDSVTKADTLVAVPTSEVGFSWPVEVADPITAHEQSTYTHEGTTFRLHNVVPDVIAPTADAIRFDAYNQTPTGGVTHPLRVGTGNGHGDEIPQVFTTPTMSVRRLTPREAERLQGFPDDWTAIIDKGKIASDGPRYKALGNSMAVNVMRFIGERIHRYEAGEL